MRSEVISISVDAASLALAMIGARAKEHCGSPS
jgi:hypothetical protein